MTRAMTDDERHRLKTRRFTSAITQSHWILRLKLSSFAKQIVPSPTKPFRRYRQIQTEPPPQERSMSR